MEIFSISDDTINTLLRKKRTLFFITIIFSMIICGFLSFFSMRNISTKISVIIFCTLLLIILFVIYFSIMFSLKKLSNKMKNVKYIIEDEKLFIKQNDSKEFNFSKNEIQSINRYKNSEIIIVLNTNKKIIVNKYLDNYDQLIKILNTLSKINEIDKNPDIDLSKMDMTRLIACIIIFILLIFIILLIKIFNISIPKSGIDKHDPMILLVEVLPCIIFAAILIFIANRIDKKIKNKNRIVILFFLTQIVLYIIILIDFYLQSFKLGLLITSIMLFFMLLEIIFLKTSYNYTKKKNE